MSSGNTELVFLLHPRVIVFTAADARTPRNGEVGSGSPAVSSPVAPKIDSSMRIDNNKGGQGNSHPDSHHAAIPPSREADMVAKMPAVMGDETDTLSPVSSSIEIQPLPEVTTGHKNATELEKDPSVIVNYDVLGH